MGQRESGKDKRRGRQTYLVKELVLSQVPDVPRLSRKRKTRSDTEAWLVVRDTLQVLPLVASRHQGAPGPRQPPGEDPRLYPAWSPL